MKYSRMQSIKNLIHAIRPYRVEMIASNPQWYSEADQYPALGRADGISCRRGSCGDASSEFQISAGSADRLYFAAGRGKFRRNGFFS